MGSEGDGHLGSGRGRSARDLMSAQRLALEEATLFALCRQLVEARWCPRADGSPPMNPAKQPNGVVIQPESIDNFVSRLRTAESSLRKEADRIETILDTMDAPTPPNSGDRT